MSNFPPPSKVSHSGKSQNKVITDFDDSY